MTRLQYVRTSIFSACAIGLLFPMSSNAIAAHNDSPNHYIEVDIESLVTKSTLECDSVYRQNIAGIAFALQESTVNRISQNQFAIGNHYKINGVKLISTTYKKSEQLRTVNMDVDFTKFGVRILRISSFVYDGDEAEGFGYYFILKGKPSMNKSFLEKENIDMDLAMKTKGGNTRIPCVIAG